MKLLIIDGNNFAKRASFTYPHAKFGGERVNVLYGFYLTLAQIIGKFESTNVIVLWDGGYAERLKISTEAVEQGIIDSSYKQNRRDGKDLMTDEEKEESEDFRRQVEVLIESLKHTIVQQVLIPGVEADDLAASYVRNMSVEDEAVLISSDKDFYQLLSEDVVVYDPIKRKTFDDLWMKTEFDLTPKQWVDFGALVGDGGDNIHGCKGVGDKTALPWLHKWGSYEAVIDNIKDEVEVVRRLHPDLEDVPCSGIREALEDRSLKSLPFPKIYLAVVEQEKKIRLAYRLKQMISDVDIPEPEVNKSNERQLEEFFRKHGLRTLQKHVSLFASDSVMSPDLFSKVVKSVAGPGVLQKCESCGEEVLSKKGQSECPHCGAQDFEEETEMGVAQSWVQLTLFE